MKLSKQHWIYLTVTLGFLTQIFLSQTLWYSETRQFFLVPMLDALPLNMGNVGNMILFIGLLLSLIVGMFYQKRYLLITILAFLSLLFLQDLTRIQAWSYQYFLTFLVLVIDWKKEGEKDFFALKYIMIFTYFWSGIQKFNPHYAEVVHPWLFSALSWSKPFAESVAIGYLTAAVETLIGVGLLFSKTRKVAVITGILMHGFILLMIGPWGEDWNSVVYPWNLVMMGLLVILFWQKPKENEHWFLFKNQKQSMEWLMIGILGIFPIFNLFMQTPETISMTMYNGVTSEVGVYFNENPDCIPAKVKDKNVYPGKTGYRVSLDDWGFAEINVPIYALPTYAEKFGRQFCDCVTNKKEAGVKITYTKRWEREDYKIIKRIDCKDL